MERRRLHKIVTSKLTYVLIIAIFFGLLSIIGLRSNYSTMVDLREAVITADQNDGDVETALAQLRQHVYGHMNTNLSSDNSIKPPIQLKGRYDRLLANDQANVKAQNAKVADDGAVICGKRFPAGGFNSQRVACIQDYVSANAVKENSVADDLYKFDFVSPRWSPDLAGVSIILFIVFFTIFTFGFIAKLIRRHYL